MQPLRASLAEALAAVGGSAARAGLGRAGSNGNCRKIHRADPPERALRFGPGATGLLTIACDARQAMDACLPAN